MKRLLAALVIAAAIVPIGAQASHCVQNVIIFSGVDTGQNSPTNGSPVRPGPNGALVGCTVDPNDESLAVIWPGATNMVVALTGAGSTTVVTGTLTFNGVETELTFTYFQPVYATSARWESQSIPAPLGAGPVTATVFADGEEVNTVTYQKYA